MRPDRLVGEVVEILAVRIVEVGLDKNEPAAGAHARRQKWHHLKQFIRTEMLKHIAGEYHVPRTGGHGLTKPVVVTHYGFYSSRRMLADAIPLVERVFPSSPNFVDESAVTGTEIENRGICTRHKTLEVFGEDRPKDITAFVLLQPRLW